MADEPIHATQRPTEVKYVRCYQVKGDEWLPVHVDDKLLPVILAEDAATMVRQLTYELGADAIHTTFVIGVFVEAYENA